MSSGEYYNPFFEENANKLAEFLAGLPNLNPYDWGDDPQKSVAEYVPPPGFMLSEQQRATQDYFAKMGPKAFSDVYLTLQVRKQRRSE